MKHHGNFFGDINNFKFNLKTAMISVFCFPSFKTFPHNNIAQPSPVSYAKFCFTVVLVNNCSVKQFISRSIYFQKLPKVAFPFRIEVPDVFVQKSRFRSRNRFHTSMQTLVA